MYQNTASKKRQDIQRTYYNVGASEASIWLLKQQQNAILGEVNKARAHEEWKVEYMSLFLRDQEKIEEGEEKTRRSMILNMLREKDPIDKICRIAECDEAYVKEIQAELENENP